MSELIIRINAGFRNSKSLDLILIFFVLRYFSLVKKNINRILDFEKLKNGPNPFSK